MRNRQFLIVVCVAFLRAIPLHAEAEDLCPQSFGGLLQSTGNKVPHRPSIMGSLDGSEYPVAELSKGPAKKLAGVPPVTTGGGPIDLPEKVRFTLPADNDLTSTHYVDLKSVPEDIRKVEKTVYYGRPSESPEAALEYLKKIFHEGRKKIGDPTWDIWQHINGPTAAGVAIGSKKARTNTGFYSTSSSFGAAVGFGPGNYNTHQGLVVVIEGKGSPGLDLVKFSRHLDQKNEKVLARSILSLDEAEISLTGIDPRQIRGAWVATKRVEATYIWNGAEQKSQVPYMEFFENPNFDPSWRYGK